MSIQRILSGGQTGVDRAALDFAIARQIPLFVMLIILRLPVLHS
ncbi:YpsA SLOG family protein, partial [Stutzerimonas stutzeri]